jgi:hypothetical protein
LYERTRLAHCLEWQKQFWKLGRPVFGVNQTLMCRDCQDYNYQWADERYELDIRKERLVIKSSLCKKCILLNIDITNRHLHHLSPSYPDNAYKNAKE